MKAFYMLLLLFPFIMGISQNPELVLPLGHNGKINSASYSPDGKYVATASEDKTAKIWEIKSGKLLYDLTGHTDNVNTAEFSSDGTTVITISRDKTVKTWDIQTGKLLHSSLSPLNSFTRAVLNPEKNKIATASSEEGEIKIWEFHGEEWELYKLLKGHIGDIYSINFSADGNKLVTSSFDETAKIWDVQTGKLLYNLKGHTSAIYNAVFSLDGKTVITASDDKTAKLWDVKSGKLKYTLKGHSDFINSANFSPDGKMAVTTAYSDNVIRIWDSENGKLLHKIKTKTTPLNAVFNPDGTKLLINSNEVFSLVYDVQTEDLLYSFNGGNPCLFSPKGDNIFTSSNYRIDMQASYIDGIPKIWNTENGKLLNRLEGHSYYVISAKYSPDKSKILTLSGDNFTRLWDVKNGKLLYSLNGHKYFVRSAVFSPHGKKILTYSPLEMKIWDVQSGENIVSIEDKTSKLKSAIFSPDESMLLMIKDNGTVNVLEANTGIVKYSIEGLSFITDASFSNNGAYISAVSDDGFAYILNAETGKLIHTLDGIPTYFGESLRTEDFKVGLKTVLFSPNDSTVVTLSEGNTLMIWNSTTGVLSFTLNGAFVTGITTSPFSADSRKIAIDFFDENDNENIEDNSEENITLIFDIKNGKFMHKPDGSITGLISKPFSPSGDKIITATKNGKIRIWNAENGALIYETKIFDTNRYLSYVEYSPNGNSIIIASYKANDKGYIYQYEPIEILDIETGKILKPFDFNTGFPKDINWNDSVLLYSFNSKLSLIDYKTGKEILSFIAIDETDYVFVLPSREYMGTKSGVKTLSWRLKNRLYGFEQWDLQYNRPDKVLEQLKNPNTSLIRMYQKAYEKRLKKLGFNEQMFSPEWHTPQIKLTVADDVGNTTDESRIDLKVFCKDGKYTLDRLNIWVNDVPLYGMTGMSLRSMHTDSVMKTVSVILNTGKNKINASCTNEKGVESLRESFEIDYEPQVKIKPNLYVFAISSNRYIQSEYNLYYAVNDGKGIANLFSSLTKDYATIFMDTLFNESARKENIQRIKSRLMNSKVDDHVILFVSGHGMLDSDLDFYYATNDINFYNPSKRGLSFAALENILDSIPARNKLLMIDACHSGEVDKSELEEMPDSIILADGTKKGLKIYSYKRSGNNTDTQISLNNAFELMTEMFTDLSKGSGAVVISAAAGTGYAFEYDKIEHGIFTWCVLEGLNNKTADLNKDGIITVNELKDFVSRNVQIYTKGNQKPTARRENLEFDFRVW